MWGLTASEQLAGIDVFASLSDDKLRAVATLAELRTVESGTRLIEVRRRTACSAY